LKVKLVERYKDHLTESTAVVFTNYKGASVVQVNALRAKLKQTGATYMVVKNGLLGIAFDQAGRSRPDNLLVGPNAVAFMGEDIGKGVTALKDWIRDAKIMEITGAVVEATVLDGKQAESLADLPTKEQTLAAILGTIQAPAATLVRMINAPASSLVRVINAYVEKRQETESAA
jgi:large subunit ribosomal protein L10